MLEPKLLVRSGRAYELAHRLAHRENCSVTDVVERALAAYEAEIASREPAASFYARLGALGSADIDLDAIMGAVREAHNGMRL